MKEYSSDLKVICSKLLYNLFKLFVFFLFVLSCLLMSLNFMWSNYVLDFDICHQINISFLLFVKLNHIVRKPVMPYSNNKGADQHVDLQSLISTFIVHYLDSVMSRVTVSGPGHAKICLMPYVNNKGADQPAHLHSLISAFVVRCIDSMICILVVS